jgi:hypothetical protein
VNLFKQYQHQHTFAIQNLTNKSQIILKINKSHIGIQNYQVVGVG